MVSKNCESSDSPLSKSLKDVIDFHCGGGENFAVQNMLYPKGETQTSQIGIVRLGSEPPKYALAERLESLLVR